MKHKPKLPRLNGVVGQVDQFRYLIRTKHYNLRTENTYVDWVCLPGLPYISQAGGPIGITCPNQI